MGGAILNQIRTLRFQHGEMSQAELGQRIGLTRQTVAAIEAGKYSPSLEAAFRIAEVFALPFGEVFQWESEQDDQAQSRSIRQAKGNAGAG